MAIVNPTPSNPRRTTPDATILPTEYAAFNRVRWGAIIAGALIAIAVSFSLNLLGVGIGFSTINPTTETSPFAGIGTGAIIWYVVSSLIALFTGGYVAGRLAGFPKETTAGLHGVLTWALFTLLSLYLLNTAVGRVFNVVGSTISTVASTTGQAVGAAVPDDLAQQIQARIQQSDISLQDIRREAFELLEDTGKPALDPDNLQQDAQQAANAVERNANQAANNPNAAGREINDIIDRISTSGGDVIEAADKDALVNVLVARTDQSEAEARRTVDAWSQQYQEAKASVKEGLDQLGETATEVGGDVADTLATVSILGFLALLAGAGAGFFGGVLGRTHDVTLSGDGQTIAATDVD
ncbi:hypothetical protein LEM8419_01646 [Neolewinella maritima]|uniref:PhnA-like protein n=1 Tax=Neolewinella maritima TaxID=1383882 RepID=A0ABN8F6C9_9BACT|nr:hypothetical protein [Neolewinella maritima]CAH1000493.1 hypothetical protein LEM8419_01646 [Neolewinella maritima]